MPFFNNLYQYCLAYYKQLTEMTQRGKFLTGLVRVAGNDLATKFFQRVIAEVTGTIHLILSYMVYYLLLHPHCTVGLNVNQYIKWPRTALESSR